MTTWSEEEQRRVEEFRQRLAAWLDKLLAWNEVMGGWEGPVWRQARQLKRELGEWAQEEGEPRAADGYYDVAQHSGPCGACKGPITPGMGVYIRAGQAMRHASCSGLFGGEPGGEHG